MQRLATLGLALLVACSSGAPTESPTPVVGTGAPVSLHNPTPEPFAYVAAGEGTLALLDIAGRLPRGQYQDRLVPPGATVPVEDIIGYDSRLGINFFLYRIDPAGDAVYARSRFASAAELRANDGVVTIALDRF